MWELLCIFNVSFEKNYYAHCFSFVWLACTCVVGTGIDQLVLISYFPNLSFDTRFLKPAAAAAFLNLSQLPSPVLLDKEKFPLIDMSSTQTLLSMVRSASAAAAFAAASNNNNNNNQTNNNNNDCYKSSGGATKRPNSPLDLSSRDMPPTKKAKLKSFGVDLAGTKPSTAGAICMSLCASGCSEEAQAINNWSVEEVYQFVSTIDLCKDYAEVSACKIF